MLSPLTAWLMLTSPPSSTAERSIANSSIGPPTVVIDSAAYYRAAESNRSDTPATEVSPIEFPNESPLASTPSQTGPSANRAEIAIPRDRFGNYFATGQINDTDVRLLVDTGASTIIIPAGLADRLGLRKGQSLTFKTGGGPISHYATTLESIRIGPIQIRNVAAAINPNLNEDFALLGTSALNLLHWSQSDGQLILSYQDPIPSATGAERTEPAVRFKRNLRDCMGSNRSIDQKTLNCMIGKSPPALSPTLESEAP